jgi:ribosomal protein S12 methylthiotransferase accessory factor
VVHLALGYDPAALTVVARDCRRAGVRLLTVHREPGAVVIGPVATAERPGCAACALARHRAARERPHDLERLEHRYADRFRHPDPALVDVCADTIADIVAELLARHDLLPESLSVVRLDPVGLRPTRHRFLPSALCGVCGEGPPPPAPDRFSFAHRPGRHGDGFRLYSLAERREELFDRYVDPEYGLVHRLFRDSGGLFPTTHGRVGHRVGHGHQLSLGRQLDFAACDLTAVTEGLERYGGAQQAFDPAVTRGSFTELAPAALDPRVLGLHAPEQYALPGFPFQPFHPDLVLDWVPAYSLRHRRELLVPATYAYYEWLYQPTRDRPLAYEISNGCALGGCLPEAALHGIFELAERDAFLLTWYARLCPPRIDLSSLPNRTPALMVRHIEESTGYRVHVLDITAEHGVPAVWVMAVDEQGRDGMPRALCAGGAHLDPVRAVSEALLELAPFTKRFAPAYERERGRIRRMLDDPYEVRVMEDHRLLYCAPEAYPRLEFLLDGTRSVSLAERAAEYRARPRPADLGRELLDLADRYLATGLDVLICDQTTPEHRVGCFRCVKAIVPGLLPMTFGHHARRVTDLPRVFTVPVSLGHPDPPRHAGDLNPDPHPFP